MYLNATLNVLRDIFILYNACVNKTEGHQDFKVHPNMWQVDKRKKPAAAFSTCDHHS